MNTKVLIIEDEQPAANRLEKMLAEIAPDYEVIHRCDSIESSVHFFKSGLVPDLILLDVQLGDGLSFEIFEQVKITSPIIFTTAYDEYAIKAFELNSIDYLLKPVRKEHLERGLQKFEDQRKKMMPMDWSLISSFMESDKKNFKQRFLVYAGEHLVSVPIQDVAYFYTVEKSTFLATIKGKSYPIDLSLEKLEGMVSPKDFFRVNRQYIIAFDALKKITVLSKSRIKINVEPAANEEILISNARTHDFRVWLDR